MKFFHFDQNNSGGGFVITDKLCRSLYIEATNVEEATYIAESMGVYFDGCESGIDCECCGDRWYRQSETGFITFPRKEGGRAFRSIESYAQYLADHYGWHELDGRIFFKNGTVKEIKKRIK